MYSIVLVMFITSMSLLSEILLFFLVSFLIVFYFLDIEECNYFIKKENNVKIIGSLKKLYKNYIWEFFSTQQEKLQLLLKFFHLL